MMIQMRARRWEIAVLRSMGTRKGRIAASCLLEYFLLCLPAAAVGLLLCTNMPPASVAGVVLTFLAGAGAAILHDTRRPIADQIRELEEK